jgi:hypothetical protein
VVGGTYSLVARRVFIKSTSNPRPAQCQSVYRKFVHRLRTQIEEPGYQYVVASVQFAETVPDNCDSSHIHYSDFLIEIN